MPDRLRELWAALGNDPALIAEAVARPVLAENRLRAHYYADEKIHGSLRQKALDELAGLADPQALKTLSGEYHEVEYRLVPKGEGAARSEEDLHQRIIRREPEMWQAQLKSLGAAFGRSCFQDPSALSGAIGKFQDGGEHYFVQAVIKAGPNRIRVGTMSWKKIPFSVWWENARAGFANEECVPSDSVSYAYSLPSVPPQPMSQLEVWNSISTTGAPVGRSWYACVWTGTVMVVWGGQDYTTTALNSGGRYNPTTESWAATATGTNCPAGFQVYSCAWTGSELVIWNPNAVSGSRYNPSTDTWTAMSTTGAPSSRNDPCMVWDESGVIVWGGLTSPNVYHNDGGIYNPTTDTWSATGVMGSLPSGRSEASATWDWQNNWMFVWGGVEYANFLNSGGLNNGGANWYAMSTNNAPSGRSGNSQVSIPSAGIIIWGGANGSWLGDGGYYNGDTSGTWQSITSTNAPSARVGHAAIWGYSYGQMVIWGGQTNVLSNAPYDQTGAVYVLCSTLSPTLQSNPVTAADIDSCSQGIRITWQDAQSWYDSGYGTRTYDILRNGTAIKTGIAYGTTSYTDTTGSSGTSYTYSVRYNNGCGLNATTTGSSAADNNGTPSAPTAGNNGPICAGSTLNLTASTVSGATCAWTGPNGFTSSAQNPSITNATTAAAGT